MLKMQWRIVVVVLSTMIFGMAQGQQLAAPPFQSCAATLPQAELEKQIHTLIGRMTLQEKVKQLGDVAPAIPRLGIPEYNWWNEGLHGIARNGYATVFPQAIGLAATFDPALVEQVGTAVGTEARAKFNPHRNANSARYAGLTIWSPNINIYRDPRWGRGQETYGEDPYLTGQMGAAFVRGVQGPPSFYLRADATPKHFAVHSGPESIRDGFNSIVSQHDLEDTYLAAFRTVIETAHPQAIMCSYNAINGVPACANDALLAGKVRGEWGFNGYVVSDCDAVDEITEYLHYTKDHAHGAAAALRAGVDLDCGRTYDHLQESLAEGLITEADIDRALSRLLLARLRLGMLQPAGCSPYEAIQADEVDTAQDRMLALHAAEESMVLLQNHGILPYAFAGKKVAVIGPTGDLLEEIEANYHGTVRDPKTIYEGLKAELGKDVQVSYAQGSPLAEGIAVPVARTALRTGTQEGLKAEYFDNPEFNGNPVVVRTDRRIDFDLDRALPVSGLQSAYSIRWTGEVQPPAAGNYTLQVKVDRCFDCSGHDAYALWIDGKEVLQDTGGGKKSKPDAVNFDWQDARPHAIRLEFAHTGQDEGIHLEWQVPVAAQLRRAIKVAKAADVIIATVGLSPSLEGEALGIKVPGFYGGDRETLQLPDPQKRLLRALEATGKPVVVALSSGSAVSLEGETAGARAIIETWYPGEAGGEALGRLLEGKANPSGRLPVTVYRSAKDLPAFTDYSMKGRTYRYFKKPVEYRFGYGLSYADFHYSKEKFASSGWSAGRPLLISVAVSNHGKVAGDAVAELYVIPPQTDGAPNLALKSFQRVYLQAGEEKSIRFSLPADALAIVNASGNRVIQAGEYRVFIAGGQPVDRKSAGITLNIEKEMCLTCKR